MARPLLVLLVAFAAGCGTERLIGVSGGLELTADRLEFSDTFVGFPRTAAFEVRNTGRARRSAELSVAAPFFVVRQVEVEGGSAVAVAVTFAPTALGEAVAALTFSFGGTQQVVALHGLALTPPECSALAACRASSFDPNVGACVETVLPDETPCLLDAACIESARCYAGACLGVARSCDDANACTADACDAESGCLHHEVACPPPSDPCKVAACDAASGCAQVDAPDGTLCGAADCITAQICLTGACKTVAVPDGFTCAPESPCQGKGTCHQQQCVQPAASTLTPVWSYAAPASRRLYFNGLADAAGNLYWAECESFFCELVSATRDGFIRFKVAVGMQTQTTMQPDGPGQLALVGANVVTALPWQTVEARRSTDGALVWSTDLQPLMAPFFPGTSLPTGPGPSQLVDDGRGHVVALSQPELPAAFGSPQVKAFLISLDAATGAAAWVRPVNAVLSSLIADEVGNLYAAGEEPVQGAGNRPLLASWTSAGTARWALDSSAWGQAISVYGGRLADGPSGPPTLRDSQTGDDVRALIPDGGQSGYTRAEALLAGGSVFQMIQPPSPCCPTCSCPQMLPRHALRSVTAASADRQWEWDVLQSMPPPGPMLTLSEALLTAQGALLYAVSPDWSVYSVPVPFEERLDAVGTDGVPRFSCQLPRLNGSDFTSYEGAAALERGRWVVKAQPRCFGCLVDPPPVIAVFDVPGSSLATKGWVSQRGSNARSGRPR